MNKLNLKYKARTIAKLEDELDCSLEKAIASFKTSTLVKFIAAGTNDKNLTEDESYDYVDKLIAEHGKIELQISVIEALIDAGFLPKAINTEEIRKSLSETIANVSETTGENTK